MSMAMSMSAALLASNLSAIELSMTNAESPTEGGPKWYDVAHQTVSKSANNSALWLDGFFGETDFDDPAKNFIRLRFQQELNERDPNRFRVRLSASLHLPKTQDKLKLLIESDDSSELANIDDAEAGTSSSSLDETQVALRWNPFEPTRWKVDFDVGVHFSSGLDPFARTRVRYNYEITPNWEFGASQELKSQVQEDWSETSRLSIEQLGKEHFGWRWYYRSKYGHKTNGLEWSSSLVYTTQISSASALATFVTFSGATKDVEEQSEISRLGFTYRRNFFRPWLFFEFEPHMTWPRRYSERGTWFFLGTLEMQFGHN